VTEPDIGGRGGTMTRTAGYSTAAGVVAADQLTKTLAADGVIPARLVRNTGASSGIGAGHPPLVVLTDVVITAVVAVLLPGPPGPRLPSSPAWCSVARSATPPTGMLRSPGLGRGAVVDWTSAAWPGAPCSPPLRRLGRGR
jgi:hypothetical protein